MNTNHIKVILGCCLLIFTTFSLKGNDTIRVNPNMYCKDDKIHIIVINQDVDQINKTCNNIKTSIELDSYYNFDTALETISIGIPYIVNRPADNQKYTLFFSQLPLIKIQTPNTIVDEPKTEAEFLMVESNQNMLHSLIGIEYRGGASQNYPKKSYSIEFWKDSKGKNKKDVQFFNMRTDDDWNLQAMYNEPLRIRSKTNNDLWRIIHIPYYKSK